ncbi:MAG TPA: ABC transporter substrate-binding protein [Methylomirabilota bacterium]
MIVGLIALLQALTVAVSGPPSSTEYLPVRVAVAEGYFTREGLDVTLKTTRAEIGAAEALAQGQVDVAVTSLEAMLRFGLRPKTPSPQLIFGLTSAPPVALVVAAEPRLVHGVEELAGLRIGLSSTGAPEHTWLLAVLARAKVNVGRVEIVGLGARGVAVGIETGEIQGAMLADPVATRLLEEGRVVLLADMRTVDAAATALAAPTVNAAVFVRRDRKLRDGDLAGFVRALLAAEERIRTGDADALAARLPPPAVGPGEQFGSRLRSARDLYLPRGEVSPEAVEQTIAMIRSHLPLPLLVTVPRPSELLHLEPLRRALKPR